MLKIERNEKAARHTWFIKSQCETSPRVNRCRSAAGAIGTSYVFVLSTNQKTKINYSTSASASLHFQRFHFQCAKNISIFFLLTFSVWILIAKHKGTNHITKRCIGRWKQKHTFCCINFRSSSVVVVAVVAAVSALNRFSFYFSLSLYVRVYLRNDFPSISYHATDWFKTKAKMVAMDCALQFLCKFSPL